MGKSKTEEEKEKHAMRERLRRRKFCNLYWSLREYGSFNLSASATDYEYLVAALGEAGWVVQPDGMARRVGAARPQQAQISHPSVEQQPIHIGENKRRRAADGGKLMREELLKKGDASLIDPDGSLTRLMHYAELPQFIPNLLQGWVTPKELPGLTEGELEDLGLPHGACKKLKRALSRAMGDPNLMLMPLQTPQPQPVMPSNMYPPLPCLLPPTSQITVVTPTGPGSLHGQLPGQLALPGPSSLASLVPVSLPNVTGSISSPIPAPMPNPEMGSQPTIGSLMASVEGPLPTGSPLQPEDPDPPSPPHSESIMAPAMTSSPGPDPSSPQPLPLAIMTSEQGA
eukprot:TRINITY_DN7855_c0_g1_i1.p1 TRINITY_DN7855_c0_g1~~TRINITY_DN7855_c0_g1_i1.p1  ORF type:complete len:342 (-),score=56.70 TRINITY_DN7855_c0_g1_i1:532-1557(-)